MTKKKAEPSTVDRLTEARNKKLRIFNPELMSGTEQVLDKLHQRLNKITVDIPNHADDSIHGDADEGEEDGGEAD